MRKAAFLLLILLCVGVKMPNVQAQTPSAVVSRGNLIYKGRQESVSLYAADIRLLAEKISAIPEQCFDPAYYAHTHNWEYCRINEKTHTRHCADCGDANDLTSPHKAEKWEHDTIFYEGKAYAGKRFTCACGYHWSMEPSHTMMCEALDEMNHQVRCALDGTPYCWGCEPSVEEHYAWYYEIGKDELHHEKICLDCGYRIKEACSFGEEDDEGGHVCICGRSAKQEEPDTAEPGDEPEAEEPPETPDEPEAEEPPETPDEPETGELPEAPKPSDDSGTEEAPEPSDESGTEEVPETPGESGTEEVLETPGESGREEMFGTENVRRGMLYGLIKLSSVKMKGGY